MGPGDRVGPARVQPGALRDHGLGGRCRPVHADLPHLARRTRSTPPDATAAAPTGARTPTGPTPMGPSAAHAHGGRLDGNGSNGDGSGGAPQANGRNGSASDGSTRRPLGTALNGTALNGTALNGTALNGTALNGTALNGTALNGTALNGTALNGGALNGRPPTAAALRTAPRPTGRDGRRRGARLRRTQQASALATAAPRRPRHDAGARATRPPDPRTGVPADPDPVRATRSSGLRRRVPQSHLSDRAPRPGTGACRDRTGPVHGRDRRGPLALPGQPAAAQARSPQRADDAPRSGEPVVTAPQLDWLLAEFARETPGVTAALVVSRPTACASPPPPASPRRSVTSSPPPRPGWSAWPKARRGC